MTTFGGLATGWLPWVLFSRLLLRLVLEQALGAVFSFAPMAFPMAWFPAGWMVVELSPLRCKAHWAALPGAAGSGLRPLGPRPRGGGFSRRGGGGREGGLEIARTKTRRRGPNAVTFARNAPCARSICLGSLSPSCAARGGQLDLPIQTPSTRPLLTPRL